MEIPQEIELSILLCLEIEDLLICERVCKSWKYIGLSRFNKEDVEYYLASKIIPSMRLIPKEIIDAVGGIKKVMLLSSIGHWEKYRNNRLFGLYLAFDDEISYYERSGCLGKTFYFC